MGWQQRSRTEWQRLVAGWPRSGLSQDEYCARHGQHTFGKWTRADVLNLSPIAARH
jgi:hypothetical protein